MRHHIGFVKPDFDVFQTSTGFDFGLRQNGNRVMDVEVPQWAKRSTRLFILIHRQVRLVQCVVPTVICADFDCDFTPSRTSQFLVRSCYSN